VGLVAGPGYFRQNWRRSFDALEHQGTRVTLSDGEGHAVLGLGRSLAGHQVTRTSADTGLPWILRVASADPAADLAQNSGQGHIAGVKSIPI
jgi:hypothetical protein